MDGGRIGVELSAPWLPGGIYLFAPGMDDVGERWAYDIAVEDGVVTLAVAARVHDEMVQVWSGAPSELGAEAGEMEEAVTDMSWKARTALDT